MDNTGGTADIPFDDQGAPQFPGELGQAIKAIYVLRNGGRLMQCSGLPNSYAINTSDKDWLASVTRVTLEPAGAPKNWEAKYWAGEAELPRPADLEEIMISNKDRNKVIEEGEMR